MMHKCVLTEYTIDSSLTAPLTLGLVSDLHECDPQQVLSLLRQGSPDLIVVSGDTFERHEECKNTLVGIKEGKAEKLLRGMLMKLDDLFEIVAGKWEHAPEYAYQFLREAAGIAPVFLSLGNHEWYLLPEDIEIMKDAGTRLLDNAACRVHVKGTELHIGGLSTNADLQWLGSFCAKDGYKILLCHHPEYYDRYLRDKNINLILSGHAHGGQIRICGRGIYAPGQGIFPKYTKGIYDGRMIVTVGASNTASVPRWGNPCEVVLIHLNQQAEMKAMPK